MPETLAAAVCRREPRALARALTLVENDGVEGGRLLELLAAGGRPSDGPTASASPDRPVSGSPRS